VGDNKIIITRTPLRITFTGGGSDIPDFFYKHDGHCINATIDKYVYVLVKKRFDNKIYLKYSENEVVDTVEDIQHDFIRETLKFMRVDYGLEIINWADIPTKGTGLGSSSSFLVGLLLAIHTLNGDKPTKEQLAKEACYIEVTKCNKPIGFQDQMAAAHGGLNQMVFKSDVKSGDQRRTHKFVFTDIELREISDNLMLFYTGVTRDSETVLKDQNKNMVDSKNAFTAMVNNVEVSKELADFLSKRMFDMIAPALRLNWGLKQQFSDKITNDEIITMYERGMSAGALGGKIIGAGGGGFILFYVNRCEQERVIKALSGYKHMPFKIDKYGSRVLINIEDEVW